MNNYNTFRLMNQNAPILDWEIYAFSGHMETWALKEKVELVVTKEGFKLKREESERWVIEHPQFDSTVEVSFKRNITANNRSYSLCFHSESFGIKNRDARNQKRLYYKVLSLIPLTWRKEAYWKDNGEYVLVYKTSLPLRRKRRRKY